MACGQSCSKYKQHQVAARRRRAVGPAVQRLGFARSAGGDQFDGRNQVLVPPTFGEYERLQVPHLVGRRPLEHFPDRILGGGFDFAAPQTALPTARAVDVASQPAGQHAAVHGRAAIAGGLVRSGLGVFHAVVVGFAVDAGHRRLSPGRSRSSTRTRRGCGDCRSGGNRASGRDRCGPSSAATKDSSWSRPGVPNGGWPNFSITRLAAAFQSSVAMLCCRRVEMDRTEQTDVRLVAAPDILDVPRVRVGPRVVPFPALPDVAASHFDEGDHSLGVQVVDSSCPATGSTRD